MRILVTGDRSWDCRELADRVVARLIARYGSGITIVHGAAKGVDTAFGEAAEAAGIAVESHPADWRQHGRAAGPIRNQGMVTAGAELCLAVHRSLGTSKGTKDCVGRALTAGIPTYVIESEEAEPRRLSLDDLSSR